ncbi:Zinc finger MYM-type protein 1 [Merluccius polli]|uniref:Zinc finger MYM-type protein 1 n=1 Tax=Merluccius polli TaxID=89951 RepID=A0AA47MQT5_MERPO|nr:Zinc finger MYM-type protein 1 [Merluccius polli]
MDIRKFFRPPPPQTNTARATAEPYQNRIPAAEKELQELASGSNTAAQAPPAERSEREREHADYNANPRCSGLSQTQGHDHSGPPDDLGEDKPAQIILKKFPSRLFNGQKRSFVALWYNQRDWLEYSVKAEAAFCFACRKFGTVDSVFTKSGYCDWKHAAERGLRKHAECKEHMESVAKWRERVKRADSGQEISTLVNEGQLARNRYYIGAIIDMLQFLAINRLPLRGSVEAFNSQGDASCGLFLSLFEYSVRKDPELEKILQTIPQNARYTSHDIQNELIKIMSDILTEEIVHEVSDSWFTIKVDGTRDPTGCENISIVIRFVAEDFEVRERLLTIATADVGDAKTLANTIITELRRVGLSTSKILSQVYDGASVMSGKHGGVQKILQDMLAREIPYVHCFNHQLHLVVINAMSSEGAIEDFFGKPTVAVHYKGDTLKRLLEQRWTGHLATVTVVLKSFDDIFSLLSEIDSNRAFGTDLRIEAAGLIRAVSEPSFEFIGRFVQKILQLLDAPNKMLQSEQMDLLSGMWLVKSASECVAQLRSESEFNNILGQCKEKERPQKRKRMVNKSLQGYVVEETVGQQQGDTDEGDTELRRLFYSTLDAVGEEMSKRFSERNSELMTALQSLDPNSETFLDVKHVKPILTLSSTEINEAEFVVARQFLKTNMTADDETWTISRIIKTFHSALEAMPSVMMAFKHALTFGASTAMCENSFSTLKSVLTDNRLSMLHQRKAHLVQLAFERDLTKRFTTEWMEAVMKRFNSGRRRLQLY